MPMRWVSSTRSQAPSSPAPAARGDLHAKPDLLWSDGTPVTAKDALLGYHLAQLPEAEGRWRDLAERTAQFVAVDERTLRWEGIPGYLSGAYPGFLFPAASPPVAGADAGRDCG